MKVKAPASAESIAACICVPVAKLLELEETAPVFAATVGFDEVPPIVIVLASPVATVITPVTGASIQSIPLPVPSEDNNCPAVPVPPLTSIKSASSSKLPVTLAALDIVTNVPVSSTLESASVVALLHLDNLFAVPVPATFPFVDHVN